MSEDPLPPGHGEDEYWHSVPVCPICGGMVRAEVLDRRSSGDPVRSPYRCDLHGEVTPVWMWPDDEEEE